MKRIAALLAALALAGCTKQPREKRDREPKPSPTPPASRPGVFESLRALPPSIVSALDALLAGRDAVAQMKPLALRLSESTEISAARLRALGVQSFRFAALATTTGFRDGDTVSGFSLTAHVSDAGAALITLDAAMPMSDTVPVADDGAAAPLARFAERLVAATRAGGCTALPFADDAMLSLVAGSSEMARMIGAKRTASIDRLPFTCAELLRRVDQPIELGPSSLLVLGLDSRARPVAVVPIAVELLPGGAVELVLEKSSSLD